MSAALRPVLFIDRDGTLILEKDYPHLYRAKKLSMLKKIVIMDTQ